ncbi:hypothetical protein [Herbaspirillum lusitanum]|uniref:hypothetical protein n=1 Tax=Herbaspirillum lusitanum TaxID=213312 RepID=UPI002237A495|nr:hypothetical protein [Herbaspirillum lusitanum]
MKNSGLASLASIGAAKVRAMREGNAVRRHCCKERIAGGIGQIFFLAVFGARNLIKNAIHARSPLKLRENYTNKTDNTMFERVFPGGNKSPRQQQLSNRPQTSPANFLPLPIFH